MRHAGQPFTRYRPTGPLTYYDKAHCPKCQFNFILLRKRASVGKIGVETQCPQCKKMFLATAGKPDD